MTPNPDLSIVIPTHNRPDTLMRAVESALDQLECDVEVVVVDDGSSPPVVLPEHRCLRCLRLEGPQGAAAARNAGLAAALGRYITFLDDDDCLLPHMASVSIAAISHSVLPAPVAVISGVAVVSPSGDVLERRFPPSHRRGQHFSLEPLPPGRSHVTKNTLVVDRTILLALGGFDGSLETCILIDLFLRLNAVCSIAGISAITYQLSRDRGRHLSRDVAKRMRGIKQLERKHRQLLAAHPAGHADALLGEARLALAAGSIPAAARHVYRAFGVAPRHVAGRVLDLPRWFRSLRHLPSSG